QVRKRLRDRREATLLLGIVFVAPHEHADAPHAAALLRARSERPRRRDRAAERSDEFAPPDFEHRLPPGQNYPSWGALSPSVLGPKDTIPRVRQIGCCTGCCTAESRPPPPTGLWQRRVINRNNPIEHFSSAFFYGKRTYPPASYAASYQTSPSPRRGYPPRRRSGPCGGLSSRVTPGWSDGSGERDLPPWRLIADESRSPDRRAIASEPPGSLGSALNERAQRNRQASHAQSRLEHTSAVGFDLSVVADHSPRFSAAAACINI